jgi:hypothetical protein
MSFWNIGQEVEDQSEKTFFFALVKPPQMDKAGGTVAEAPAESLKPGMFKGRVTDGNAPLS